MTFPAFEEFIACLNAHEVRYLVVGGYAVGFHAQPRATKDIDILVDSTPTNARRTRAALVDFLGSDPPNITEEKLTHPRTLIVLGVAPQRIDVMTRIQGLASFASGWRRRVTATFGSTSAHFLSMSDLIQSKVAAGRPQDLADVHALRAFAARSASKPRKPSKSSPRR